MTLICKKCGAPIAVKNINFQTMVAGCDACDAVFSFSTDDLGTAKRKKIKRQAPQGLAVIDDQGDTFEIDIHWRKVMGSLEWLAVSLTGLGALFLTPISLLLWSEFLNESEVVGAIVGTGLGVIAFACWYLLAMFALNHSRLTLTQDTLDYVHFPLPWRNQHIARDSIIDIELKPVESDNNYRQVVIVTDDGSHHALDSYQLAHANYLEHRLQAVLTPPENVLPDTTQLEDAELDQEVRLGDDGEWQLVRANQVRGD